ncbi:MAG: transglutaminase-like cysteine peptidase [Hyphomicrobiales bacterium]
METRTKNQALACVKACACFVIAALALVALQPGSAAAENAVFNFNAAKPSSTFAREFGTTLPPAGWVDFCKIHPEDCHVAQGKRVRVKLDGERWSELKHINGFVNREIEPFTDKELHDVEELWSYPENGGDCEDYVLLKRRYLMDLGWPREALLITVVLDDEEAGHAVLTVITDRGEFVLDNQQPEIKVWNNTSYTFLKRQSQEHPMQWVSLNRHAPRKGLYVSGN